MRECTGEHCEREADGRTLNRLGQGLRAAPRLKVSDAGGAEGVKATVIDSYKPEGALFGFLQELPLYSIISPIALVLIVIFFVTSSDSGSLVIDTITAGGKMDAPVVQRVFWCTLEGLVAIELLLGGGLAVEVARLATEPGLALARVHAVSARLYR